MRLPLLPGFVPIVLALPVLALPVVAPRAQDVLAAVRADHWPEAQVAAGAYPDPVAQKLVTYFRLLAPNGAAVQEIEAFMADSPDWPSQPLLARRRDEALTREPDDTAVVALCAARPPTLAGTWLRCADAYARLGNTPAASAAARQAWVGQNLVGGDIVAIPAETAFMQRWGTGITREDQQARFDALAWTDAGGAAARQVLRLDATDRPEAQARLALRRDDPVAAALFAALSPAQRTGPELFLEHVRWLRRAGRDDEALAAWRQEGGAAELRVTAEHLGAFWDERNLLARRRLRQGDATGAYLLADDQAQKEPEKIGDAAFLAGFIALRRLGDPASAQRHFAQLTAMSKAALTQSRGHYWLARAADAAHDAAAARREYGLAAAWPTTFYGQRAIAAQGADTAHLQSALAALRDPAWTDAQAVGVAGREITRAAALLIAWGDPRRARSFLLRLEEIAPDAATWALAARLATGFGMPDEAVAIARRAGRDGTALPETGWPMPFAVGDQPVPASLALGIMRQESSFDPGVMSPVGARGLMQLMPATAAQVGRKLGLNPSLQSLTADPALNITLGTAYLRTLLDQFGHDQPGAVPLAVAAYNAGPGRVQEWLAGYGDPRGADADAMIDWIELIPFNETRNYVQRVSENVSMYAARRQELTPVSLAQQN